MKKIEYKNRVAIVYLMAYFIDLVNMFIATIAFPIIGRDLHASLEQLSWIANIYSLALALVIPASAWLSDRYGTKRIFVLALLGSLISVILCGFASSIELLILWRFSQGIFGGLLIPVGQSMVYKEFPVIERAKLSMIILTVASIAPAISPAIGGVIVDTLNWRWVFFVNVPIILIVVTLSLAWLTNNYNTKAAKFDLPGFILISIALFLIIYGLSSFEKISDIWGSLGCFVIGSGLLISFVIYTTKIKDALLDLKIMKNRSFVIGMMFMLCVPGVFLGINVLNIFLFQSVFVMTAAQTGLLMLPFSVGNFLGILIAGRLFSRVGPKPIVFTSLSIWLIGLALLLFVANKDQYSLAIVTYFLMGVGSGTSGYVAQTLAMFNIKNENLGKASAIWNLNRQLSFSVGVAVFAMIFQLLLSRSGITDLSHLNYSINLLNIFHYCFIIAAFIAIIPIIAAFQLNNREVLKLITVKPVK